jgi:hypothetical protein
MASTWVVVTATVLPASTVQLNPSQTEPGRRIR